jgi:hypothetical protein
MENWDLDSIEHIKLFKLMLLTRSNKVLGIVSISKGVISGCKIRPSLTTSKSGQITINITFIIKQQVFNSGLEWSLCSDQNWSGCLVLYSNKLFADDEQLITFGLIIKIILK